MRVYHFVSSEYGLEDIRLRRLKVARISKLNDPFEFLGVASKSHSVRKQYAALKAGWDNYMGILCFSANWQNPVQWSHYADHHRGICLGFDVKDGLQKVRYTNARLRPNPGAFKAADEMAEAHVTEILTTKFAHWKYEQEYRLFVKLNEADDAGLYFFDFGNELKLKEVIVGPLSSVSRNDVLVALNGLRKIRIAKARLAFQSFSVVKQRLERLWT